MQLIWSTARTELTSKSIGNNHNVSMYSMNNNYVYIINGLTLQQSIALIR